MSAKTNEVLASRIFWASIVSTGHLIANDNCRKQGRRRALDNRPIASYLVLYEEPTDQGEPGG